MSDHVVSSTFTLQRSMLRTPYFRGFKRNLILLNVTLPLASLFHLLFIYFKTSKKNQIAEPLKTFTVLTGRRTNTYK
jgi:hypothetical protein